MYRIDPDRYRAARALARLLHESGALSGSLQWTEAGEIDRFTWWYDRVRLGRLTQPTHRYAAGEDPEGRTWVVGLDSPARSISAQPTVSVMSAVGVSDFENPRTDYTGTSAVAALLEGMAAQCYYGWRWEWDFVTDVTAGVEIGELEATAEESSRIFEVATAVLSRDLSRVGRALLELGAELSATGQYTLAKECHLLAYEAALPSADAELGADAARAVARNARREGEWSVAVKWYDQALAIGEFEDDYKGMTDSLVGLTWAHMDRGATPKARETVAQALGLSSLSGDRWSIGGASMAAAYVARVHGEFSAAVRYSFQAVEHYDDPAWRARGLMMLGSVLREMGHLQSAQRAYQLALPLVEGASTRVMCMDALVYGAALEGDSKEFERLASEVDDVMHEADIRTRATVLRFRAKSLARLGRSAESEAAHRASIEFSRRHGFLQFSELSEIELERIPDPPRRDEETKRVEEWLLAEVGE